MTGCKETACTTCAHSEVCILKEEFLKAQRAVDGVTDHLGAWITAPNLRCKHYMKKMEVTLR